VSFTEVLPTFLKTPQFSFTWKSATAIFAETSEYLQQMMRFKSETRCDVFQQHKLFE